MQVLLIVLGLVMVGAGTWTVVLGADSVPRAGIVTPDVDTEMRFYAVWYVVAGVMLLSATRRVESERFLIRLVAAGFFAAGCARILSWIAVGKPHVIAIVLMVLELVRPLVIVPWQSVVGRETDADG